MTIQHTALVRALTILNALKLPYAVVDEQGVQHGELRIVPPKINSKRGSPTHNHVEKFDYLRRLAAAQEGDELVFQCDNDKEGESLRGSISSSCLRMFGMGNVITEYHLRTDFTVHVLILKKGGTVS